MLTYRQNHPPATTHMGSPVWTKEEDALARKLDTEGKSFTEIGKALGKTRNSVSARLRRIARHKNPDNPKNGVGSQPVKPSAKATETLSPIFATPEEAQWYRAGFVDATMFHFGIDKEIIAREIRELMAEANRVAGPME